MHIHRLEKIWLSLGMAMLVLFLAVLGIGTFAMGMHPPSHQEHLDPAKVMETAPFDNPGVRQIGENEYEVVMIAYAFGYTPERIELPAGAKVHFVVTTLDVIHGFQIPGTNVNMMLVPGEVSRMTHTFKEAGEYLILCNEYCGSAHELMAAYLTIV